MTQRLLSLLLTSVLAATAAGSISVAAEDKCPREAPASTRAAWPPSPERGEFDIVHFGEGHWNEGQGPKTMPILVQDLLSFAPDLVAFSSDMADVGSPDRLGCFRHIMQPLLDDGIPWYDSPGNHDRVAVAGPGGVANGSIQIWRDQFAGMPAPWGDAKPPEMVHVPTDEPDDGAGAATHYYLDFGPKKNPAMRLIVLDNSQHGLTASDVDQYPAVGPGQKDQNQFAFLQRAAAEAEANGTPAFVMMHQPTRDPRDPANVNAVSVNHTMGKGASPDNLLFDTIAEQTGVDAVLLGHIQGNAVYSVGSVRYFIDGGGGGTPYSSGKVGTDTGYYYGFRILRLYRDGDAWGYRTYFVPLVDHIDVEGPKRVAVGEEFELRATAIQPFDPELPPRFAGAPNEAIRVELRPVAAGPFAASVPEISYVYETTSPSIVRPVPAATSAKDPNFDPTTMSLTGRFRAVRAGTSVVAIKIGTHIERVAIKVTP